jgi:hypothetical protein
MQLNIAWRSGEDEFLIVDFPPSADGLQIYSIIVSLFFNPQSKIRNPKS